MEKNLPNIFLIFKREIRQNLIRKILNSDSFELSEPKTVLSNIKSSCSTLYKKRNDNTETDCYNYLKTLNLLRLTDDKSRLCEGELTKRECWEAVQTVGNNKSPGNDGLSKEFYVCFFLKRNPLIFIGSSRYVFSRRAALQLSKESSNCSYVIFFSVIENSPKGNVEKLYRQWEILKVQEMMVSPKNFVFVLLTKSTHIYCEL